MANLADDFRPGPRSSDVERRMLSQLAAQPYLVQLELVRTIVEFVGARLSGLSRAERLIERRSRALECLGEVAKYLGLPDRTPPTSSQYRAVRHELGLEMGVTTIAEAFATWCNAQAAYRGEDVRLSAPQRLQLHRFADKRPKFEDYFSGVRCFLDLEPVSEFESDYNAFVQEHNAALPPAARRLVLSGTIRTATGLGWEEIKAVARGEVTLEAALEQRRQPSTGRLDSGPLIGKTAVATVLERGVTSVDAILNKPGFPPPVLRHRGRRVWWREDVEAWVHGDFQASLAPSDLRDQIAFYDEVSRLLGLEGSSLSVYLCQQPDRVPAPGGRAAGSYYWWRRDLLPWKRGPRRR